MNYELLNPEKSYRTFISQIKHKQFFETSKRMHDLEWFLWTGGCSTMVLHFVCVWFFNKIANMFDPKDMKWAQFLWLASFLVKTNFQIVHILLNRMAFQWIMCAVGFFGCQQASFAIFVSQRKCFTLNWNEKACAAVSFHQCTQLAHHILLFHLVSAAAFY